MQRIGQFVRLRPHETRAHMIDIVQEIVERDVGQLFAENFFQNGEVAFPERSAPPHDIFKEARLALVHRHGRPASGHGVL